MTTRKFNLYDNGIDILNIWRGLDEMDPELHIGAMKFILYIFHCETCSCISFLLSEDVLFICLIINKTFSLNVLSNNFTTLKAKYINLKQQSTDWIPSSPFPLFSSFLFFPFLSSSFPLPLFSMSVCLHLWDSYSYFYSLLLLHFLYFISVPLKLFDSFYVCMYHGRIYGGETEKSPPLNG